MPDNKALRWTRESIRKFLADGKNKIVSDMIADLIATNSDRHEEMKQLYGEYKGRVPILTKEAVSEDGPNNKIPHDYRGEIVDQKVGYTFGNPVSYDLDTVPYTAGESKEVDPSYEKTNIALQEFVNRNNLEKLDETTGKKASICGTSSRLLYISQADKKPRIMAVEPWETIFIKDQTLDEMQHAMIYYKIQQVANGELQKEITRVEWYDATDVYYYNGVDGVFIPDEEKSSEKHGFKKVPLLEFPNKDERQGDFEKVRQLINGYDLCVSNNFDELDAFRLAYLLFYGTDMTPEQVELMKREGALEVPEGGKAEYLTKTMDGEFTENVLNRAKNDIYRFSKTVDMSDEKFSGTGESGESRKWKLKSLADDAMLKERSFSNASREMFAVLKTYWDLFGIKIEPHWINLSFTPNLPADLKYEADITDKLVGRVSEKTRLKLLSFVDDPTEEMNRMDEESESASNSFDEELNKLGITQNTEQ